MNTYSKALFLLFAITLFSCDKDYNTIGSDIVGDEHFEFEKYTVQNLVSYNASSGAVQSNNLALNALGVYKNPVFGTTKAHFVTQVALATNDYNVGTNITIEDTDSVYVYIPFFSTITNTDDSGNRTFELDSIIGDETQKFKLGVYESKYFLRDFNPVDNKEQRYYSNFPLSNLQVNYAEKLNSSTDLSQNDEFYFNNSEIIIYKTNDNGDKLDADGNVTTNPELYVVEARKSPGIWLDLNKTIIKQRILDAAASGKLLNNNVFYEYFRGLLFQVEELNPDQGAMALLNFRNAQFRIQFHSQTSDETEVTKKTMELKLGSTTSRNPNCINILENTNVVANYSNAITNADPVNGDERLYIKGGEGSIAYIKIFNDAELLEKRNENWLINDAFLTFYIDNDAMGQTNVIEPNRILLFNATDYTQLTDYFADPTTLADTKLNKYLYGGIIDKEETSTGVKYRFRLSRHILNLLNDEEAENVVLGLSVTGNINQPAFRYSNNGGTEVANIPEASIFQPLGTVLHGAQSTNIDKKLKLEIYYTKPN